jgi:hypothetical protein
VCILFIVVSCSNDNQNKEIQNIVDTTSVKTTDTVDSFTQFKYDMVISNIPFPFEMLEKLYTSKISFSQNLMNPSSNISKYSQFNSKALGLGVYGADLAYAVTYEQFQQIGSYVKNTKKLAEELNIPLAFNQDMMDKYSKFKDNKDSLAKVVYDSYTEVDKTLKSNERIGMAGLVVTGSWLEGLHLTTKALLNAPNHENKKYVYEVIWQQKLHLDNIIKLLDEFKNEKLFASILTDLNEIKSIFTNLEKGTEINEKELINLQQKVEKLRNKFVEGM